MDKILPYQPFSGLFGRAGGASRAFGSRPPANTAELKVQGADFSVTTEDGDYFNLSSRMIQQTSYTNQGTFGENQMTGQSSAGNVRFEVYQSFSVTLDHNMDESGLNGIRDALGSINDIMGDFFGEGFGSFFDNALGVFGSDSEQSLLNPFNTGGSPLPGDSGFSGSPLFPFGNPFAGTFGGGGAAGFPEGAVDTVVGTPLTGVDDAAFAELPVTEDGAAAPDGPTPADETPETVAVAGKEVAETLTEEGETMPAVALETQLIPEDKTSVIPAGDGLEPATDLLEGLEVVTAVPLDELIPEDDVIEALAEDGEDETKGPAFPGEGGINPVLAPNELTPEDVAAAALDGEDDDQATGSVFQGPGGINGALTPEDLTPEEVAGAALEGEGEDQPTGPVSQDPDGINTALTPNELALEEEVIATPEEDADASPIAFAQTDGNEPAAAVVDDGGEEVAPPVFGPVGEEGEVGLQESGEEEPVTLPVNEAAKKEAPPASGPEGKTPEVVVLQRADDELRAVPADGEPEELITLATDPDADEPPVGFPETRQTVIPAVGNQAASEDAGAVAPVGVEAEFTSGKIDNGDGTSLSFQTFSLSSRFYTATLQQMLVSGGGRTEGYSGGPEQLGEPEGLLQYDARFLSLSLDDSERTPVIPQAATETETGTGTEATVAAAATPEEVKEGVAARPIADVIDELQTETDGETDTTGTLLKAAAFQAEMRQQEFNTAQMEAITEAGGDDDVAVTGIETQPGTGGTAAENDGTEIVGAGQQGVPEGTVAQEAAGTGEAEAETGPPQVAGAVDGAGQENEPAVPEFRFLMASFQQAFGPMAQPAASQPEPMDPTGIFGRVFSLVDEIMSAVQGAGMPAETLAEPVNQYFEGFSARFTENDPIRGFRSGMVNVIHANVQFRMENIV